MTAGLSKFQLALWYWFEMELRYVDLCKSRGITPVMQVDIDELNDRETAKALFKRLGIRHRPLDLEANRNLGPRKTVIAEREREEALRLPQACAGRDYGLTAEDLRADLAIIGAKSMIFRQG